MAFDTSTRNRLQKFVSFARSILSDEFTRQFQATYGMDPKTGSISDVESLSHLDNHQRQVAKTLRETFTYYLDNTPGKSTADRTVQVLDRMVREQAFTVLNRLAALRMVEERGFLLESIGQGYSSKGFKLYQHLTGNALGETGQAYQSYLFSLFDEFTQDLAVLFDRNSLHGLLFPRESTLLELLDEINHPEIDLLWAEDETIGWIYQYWNSKEERKAMRDASAAPRNSRELAVRNQFFTPRYVVEFLTDNTLGRIWYEMTQGQTCLTDQCRYLVRRPTEIFLGEGEDAPATPEGDTEGTFSQEELLKQPVYIPHRPVKDPREIRLLDPACGSMHFGLYAFDLFEAIYEESWDKGLCPALQEVYSEKVDYLRDVPRLIIEHNLHGVDIDARAVQIAGLSLWLRAQRSWEDTPAAERPRIRRSNIVCAEPMPGNEAMLEDFVQTLDPPLLGELVRTVFDKMQLAGEAGTLLKIEEEIRTAIDDARREWEKLQSRHPELFSNEEIGGLSGQQELSNLDSALNATGSQLTGDFFDSAEERIYTALQNYAESAETDDYQRRLFAEDAAHGFAFIDLCRKRYDAVVMNPPFGQIVSRALKAVGDLSKNFDCFTGFVERGRIFLEERGVLGAITPRSSLFLGKMGNWRTDVFLGQSRITTLADLGHGVLDDALVEACAYVLEVNSQQHQIAAFRTLDIPITNKGTALITAIMAFRSAHVNQAAFLNEHNSFMNFPDRRIPYWAPQTLIRRIGGRSTISSLGVITRGGLSSGYDFRFLRLFWEVSPSESRVSSRWAFFSKGGEYSPYCNNLHLVVYWFDRGRVMSALNEAKGSLGSNVWMLGETIKQYFGREGITWPRRTTSGFSPQPFPKGCVFGDKGTASFPPPNLSPDALLAIAMATPIRYGFELLVASGDEVTSGSAARAYNPGDFAALAVPKSLHSVFDENGRKLAKLGQRRLLPYILVEWELLNYHLPSMQRFAVNNHWKLLYTS